MAYGGYGDFPPYVPVAQRLAKARRKLEQLAERRGRAVAPVSIEPKQKQIALSFWGKAWCAQLERHSDYASRLPRGRTYVRNGSVLDLQIEKGKVEAYVAGTELYTVQISLKRLAASRWQQIIAACTGRIGSLIGLLRGELSNEVLTVLTHARDGLFPAPSEIDLSCSCPDGAYMCKHVAAVLYGVGARLDQSPELFFVLRQVDQAELLAGGHAADVLATAGATSSGTVGKKRIAGSAVAALFGIELDDSPGADNPVAESALPVTKSARKQAPVHAKAAARTGASGPKKKVAAKERPSPAVRSSARKKKELP